MDKRYEGIDGCAIEAQEGKNERSRTAYSNKIQAQKMQRVWKNIQTESIKSKILPNVSIKKTKKSKTCKLLKRSE